MQYLGATSKGKLISVHFQGKPFNTTATQVYATTTYAKEADDQFYEDVQHLLEPTLKTDVPLITGYWNAK